MKKRVLGKTGLQVSEIGLGCWQLGGKTTINNFPTTYGDVTKKEANSIIMEAISVGINVFDTADFYSLGNCEKRLGEVLKEYRSKIYIFSKAGNIPSYDSVNPIQIDISYHHLMAAMDRSLDRLQTNYVDLFQAHKAPQTEKEFDGLEKTFNELKSQGKTRFCGVSIGYDYEKGIQLIERGIVDTIQLHMSLLDIEPIKKLLPLAKKNQIGIIISKPLAQGFLTGKYLENHIFSDHDVRSKIEESHRQKRLSQSKEFLFLKNNLKTLSESSLAYLLNYEEVSTVIPGAKSVEHIRSNIKASETILSNKEIVKIEEIHKKWK